MAFPSTKVEPTKNMQAGGVIVVREDNTSLSQWPLARIVQAHNGRDDLVKVVKLNTNNGTYMRPVTQKWFFSAADPAIYGGGVRLLYLLSDKNWWE